MTKIKELIKEPPDAIDNYDIIGLRDYFQNGTIREIFFDKHDKRG